MIKCGIIMMWQYKESNKLNEYITHISLSTLEKFITFLNRLFISKLIKKFLNLY
jgi:hypothetical protein